MSEIIFPDSPGDGTTFFHEDTVCVYHGANNTWECRAISSETPQPPSPAAVHLDTVAAIEAKGYATEDYVNQQIANSGIADLPTRAEFNALVTTVMAAIAGNQND